ncbi:MAG: tetratricopeptide repeat protein [Planctomycetota bacterium]|jgi:tetratricopeptide (TPR) repeat protein
MNVNKLIEKGEDAHKKRNYDYAISIFLEAVSFAPNNRKAREGLRKAELKKYENAYPSPLMVAVFGLGARLGMLVAGIGKKANPEAYMMACERFLRIDPKNKGVNMALGEAAAIAGHLDAAIFAYETASEHNPGDATALKHLGALLWQNGQIQEAHGVYDRAVQLDPKDQEAVKARKNLAAEASLKETGFETARSSRDLVKDKDAAGRLEQEARMFQTDDDLVVQKSQIEKKLEAEPENIELLKDLAEVHVKAKEYDAAIGVMERAIEIRPDDIGLKVVRGDIVVNRMEEEIFHLRRDGKTGEADAKQSELTELLVEEYKNRVKAYPTDLKLRFKLGELHLEKGDQDLAIAQFQQTVRDARYKIESQIRLGRAFASKGQADLAIRQWEQALEGHSAMSERVKDIYYSLGDVLESQGKAAKAKEYFGKIYEVDINFRDVADRLSKLDSG